MPTERFVCLTTGVGIMLALVFIGADRLPPHWDKAAHFVCFALIPALLWRGTAGRAALARLALERGLAGHIGIGHTRWATHGVPSERNAHPHVSGGVSVVHNGIIENHEEMRAWLRSLGYEFTSDTDTEVIAHLVHSFLAGNKDLFQAVRAATREL